MTDYARFYNRGHAAHENGHNPFPTGDPDVWSAIADLPVGGGAADIMRAWSDGWNAANDAAAWAAINHDERTTP